MEKEFNISAVRNTKVAPEANAENISSKAASKLMDANWSILSLSVISYS